ncbi:MAG: hypothetical protein HWD61_05785 [Parachlamydiaceae bacterium]|nr:MAG: hypothetical protein HWD61_05785 [Parachlamydiaceae bacterium]
MATQAEVIVFCSYDAWKHVQQASLIESLLNQEKPVILITLRDPFDATLFPQADQILITFSPTPHSIQAAADELNLTNLFSIFVSTKRCIKLQRKFGKMNVVGRSKGLPGGIKMKISALLGLAILFGIRKVRRKNSKRPFLSS